MSRELGILDEAAGELADATEYLESASDGLGAAFLAVFEAKLRLIASLPESGPRLENAPPGHELRAFLLRRFPYIVVVGPFSGRLTVVAVAHTSRSPGYWMGRLR